MVETYRIKDNSFEYRRQPLFYIAFDSSNICPAYGLGLCLKHIIRSNFVIVPAFTPIGCSQNAIQIVLLESIKARTIVWGVSVKT